MRRRLLLVGAALLPALALPMAAAGADPQALPQSGARTVTTLRPVPQVKGEGGKKDNRECLERKRVKEAERWADDRAGEISFAVLDECGRLLGDHPYRVHYSASVVKVMLMVAYLRRSDVRHDDLTDDEKSMLGPMITMSDNDAANQVYGLVGDDGLYDLARKAKMKHFTTMPTWGGSEITAGDQVNFVGRIERYVPKRHEAYALGLMSRVVEPQRWGIPRLPLPGWKVAIKGGWSPQASGGGWRVNQVALLRRHGRRLSVAILTSDDPDFGYGRASIEGVGKRLLRAYRTK
jgi:hypothetical protein